MRKLLLIIPALTITSMVHSHNNLYDNEKYGEIPDIINVDDTIACDTVVCDTLVEWEDVSVGILDEEEPESRFSVLGESSASLYKDKKFEYTSPEGCEYVFSVNPDGVSVTLEKGKAKNVEVLTIPNGVNGLGSYFFVTAIGDFAFTGHSLLGRREGEILPMDGVKKLIIPEGIEYVGQNCFDNADDLEEVEISSSLKNLGYYMFGSCDKLKSVYIPMESNLQTIESFVFTDCPSLEAFTIPASVSKIQEGPWRNCKSLEELGIAENNYNFHVYEGVLYNRDRKHLIQYPAGKRDVEYFVGFGIQSIDNSAFYGNDYLSTVKFPASLDSISHIAFFGCSNLQNVVFNDTITSIGNYAFEKCPKLQTIQLYGNPQYTYDGPDDPYNTFEPSTKVDIEAKAPNPKLTEGKGTILERVWNTVSEYPYFQEMEIPDNEDYGFPHYLGKGKATVYGNADPKEDVLRLLDLIPHKLLVFEDIDKKGRITRYYVDYGKKQVLYFRGGIGGNDLVVALFEGGDKKQIKGLFNEVRKKQIRL